MKKIAIVLGVAAVATLTGCRDQDYDAKHGKQIQDEPKSIETTPVKPVEQAPAKGPDVKVEESHCTCAPGTKHTSPCACGASDCKCVVEKPAPVTPPPAPEYTTYVVQNGDYLSKISAKFNVTISSIKRLNNLKSDVIRVGQKLKLPGKIDVGVQSAPAKAATKPNKTAVKKAYAPYTGATKEYVVKNGDTLGSVAYGNGINIRQLKELNKLTGDSLKVGQKLKVPAEKVVKPAKTEGGVKPQTAPKPTTTAPAKSAPSTSEVVKVTEPTQPPVASETAKTPTPAEQTVPEVKTPTESSAKSAAQATTTYVVQEGEDLTRLAIDFGVSTSVIRELNNLGENDTIKPGQVLKLPAESQQ